MMPWLQKYAVKPDISRQRYERKFTTEMLSLTAVNEIIKSNPACFSEIFKPRYINNIYLDTPELNYYFDNIIGKTTRKKVRVRWYGDPSGEIKNPVLELKTKNGLVGDKLSFELEPFFFGNDFNHLYLNRVFEKSKLPAWVLNELIALEPALFNRYCRKYFISFDKNFRLTLDWELEYGFITKYHNIRIKKASKPNQVVIELKYFPGFDLEASGIAGAFPFRLSRNSKYVNGIQIFRNHIIE